MNSVLLVNAGYELAVTPPEEGAGAAYNTLKQYLLGPLGIATVDLPMDLAERVLTNGEAVADTSRFVRSHPKVTYVKGPGITPRDDQVLSAIRALEKNNLLTFKGEAAVLNDRVASLRTQMHPARSEANLEAFAREVQALLKKIGSPNAAWRSDLAANLARGTSDSLAKRSLVNPPVWNAQTPLTVAAMPADDKNCITGIAGEDATTTLTIGFRPHEGLPEVIKKQDVSVGTPVRLFTFDKPSIRAWATKMLEAVAPNTQIAHGTKQTVLKTDVTLIQWMEEVLSEKGAGDHIAPFAKSAMPGKLGNLLVDDLFSRLSTTDLKDPMVILSPNASYAEYVNDVWAGVKAAGGFKPPLHSEIVRASATGDHYKAIEYIAPQAGVIEVKDAQENILGLREMQAGDVAMITYFDRRRVQGLIRQTLDNARKSGRTNMLFGFDERDDYYRIAIQELQKIRLGYSDLRIEVLPPAEATMRYLTGGVKDTVLLLNNIQGDFATDIEINGKGTSYSVGTIYDGRGVVELGSGGTAPDLLYAQGKGYSWEETGTLRFNPMSFVEGISLAMRYAANNMPNGEQRERTLAVAKAIEDGMYATTDKGIVVPIVKGKFSKTAEDYTVVSTQTFLKSVQVEAMERLKNMLPSVDDGSTKSAKAELDRMIIIDKALYAADAQYKGEWDQANLSWNAARRKAGTLDAFLPDFSISIPQEASIEKITPQTMLGLQKARAALAQNPSDPAAISALAAAFMALGIDAKHQQELVEAETAMLAPKRKQAA